jgi:hypothetical protein
LVRGRREEGGGRKEEGGGRREEGGKEEGKRMETEERNEGRGTREKEGGRRGTVSSRGGRKDRRRQKLLRGRGGVEGITGASIHINQPSYPPVHFLFFCATILPPSTKKILSSREHT